MTDSPTQFPSDKLLRMLDDSARRSGALHGQFLQMRQNGLQDMRALIAMQIQAPLPAFLAQPVPIRKALFDSHQLDAFGTGQISKCFGPAYARYDQLRIPRIPNGDLKMMSRIVSINGCPGEFDHPASVVAEYDVPADAWYFRDNAYPQIPTALLMEIALQPCGFLSAYLDSYALVPYEHFYFRNLDGSARVLASPDLRGKTITTQARMLSSVLSSGTVIQKFAFELSCAGQMIYAGESLFGYFSAESMANQLGLDGGRKVLPALREPGNLAHQAVHVETQPFQSQQPTRPDLRLPERQLNFLDDIVFDRQGGRFGKGYIYSSRAINPADWFYTCHFFQDPVMPGSLGVEAILQSMQAFALANDVGDRLRSPHFGVVPGIPPVVWRYRGQITPRNELMELEVHIQSIEQQAGRVIMLAEASLWVDGLRIYEVKHAAVGIFEG